MFRFRSFYANVLHPKVKNYCATQCETRLGRSVVRLYFPCYGNGARLPASCGRAKRILLEVSADDDADVVFWPSWVDMKVVSSPIRRCRLIDVPFFPFEAEGNYFSRAYEIFGLDFDSEECGVFKELHRELFSLF